MEARTRDILSADIVTLEATDDWSYNLAWLPSREPDDEFDRYELLRSNDTGEFFEDNDGDNTADCLQSGSCVLVTTLPQRADTIKYQDDDATLVATTLRDTTLMLPRPVDTTLIFITPADTTLVDTTLVITPADTTQVETTLVLIIPVDTTVVDTTLPVFNYVVLTYDVAGEYVRSNIVGDTLKPPPTAVTLTIPAPGSSETTIGLEWTQASWPGVMEAVFFSRYEVWRNSVSSPLPGAAGSSYQLIAFFADIDVTSYPDADENLRQGKDYFYVIVVRDIFGKGAVSREVKGWTKP